MAFALTCPECSAKLKTASAIPVGRKVQCPKCKNAFEVTDDNQEEVSEAKKAAPAKAPIKPVARPAVKSAPSTDDADDDRPAKPPAKPAAKPAVKTAPSVARKTEPEDDNPFGGIEAPVKKRRDDEEDESPRKRKRVEDEDDDERPRSRKRVDDEDDDRPRKKGRDEEDEAPRKGKRVDDDEDESPRSRKRVVDDEDEEEKPRKKGRVVDDEDDDSPRARKRGRKDEDEEDDDDRPRRGRDDEDDDDDDRPRAKKKKKKGNKGLMIGLAAGGVAAVVGLVFLLIWLFSGSNEMLAYLPDDTNLVIGVNVEKLFKEAPDAETELENGVPGANEMTALVKKAGLSVKDISKIVIGGDTVKDTVMFIVQFKKSIDKDKINKAINATEAKSDDKTYYKTGDFSTGYLFYPKDDLMILSAKEETMKKVIGRKDKLKLNESLLEHLDKVGDGTIYFAGSIKSGSDASSPGSMVKSSGIEIKELQDALATAKGFGGQINLDGDSAKIQIIAKCDSGLASKAAEKTNSALPAEKKKAESMLAFMPFKIDAIGEAINSLEVKNDGDVLQVSTKFNYKNLIKQAKNMMGGMGGGIGAPDGSPPINPAKLNKGDSSRPSKQGGGLNPGKKK